MKKRPKQPNRARQIVKNVIDDAKKSIKDKDAKIALEKDPNFLATELQQNAAAINLALMTCRNHHSELLPFVKNIGKYVQDITETTHACAVYLILCHTFQSWNSIFLLAEHGQYSEVMSACRKIKESTKLATLFAMESFKNKSKYLDQWYSGKIILHSIGRKKTNEFLDEILPSKKICFEKAEACIYQMESQHSHHGYAAILECISPYIEDYDLEGFTGFSRIVQNLRYLSSTMGTTNITLRHVYSLLLKDKEGDMQLDKILIKYCPQIKQSVPEEIFEPFFYK